MTFEDFFNILWIVPVASTHELTVISRASYVGKASYPVLLGLQKKPSH